MNDEQMFVYQSGKWYGIGDFFNDGLRITSYEVSPPEEIIALQKERDMAFNELDALCEQGKTEATLRKELAIEREKYMELIYQVGNKYPDESRHETALRYIKEAEQHTNEPAKETPKDEL